MPEITTAFVQQYGNNVELLLQQKGSKLRDTVTIKSGIVGKAVSPADQIGPVTATKRTKRNENSPIIATPYDKRWMKPVDYHWGDMIDNTDKLRMLIDPKSAYVQNGAYALGRAMDDEIVSAFFGTNLTGEEAGTQTTFNAANVVAAADTGFTVSKLKAARKILRANEVDLEAEQLFCVITSQQEDELLNDNEYINGDYGKAVLDQGKLKSFMGFNFVVKENLPTDSSDNRRIMVYPKSGVCLGIWQDRKVQITERADMCFNWYVYLCQTVGATRLDEKKCVEIVCAE